MVRIIRWPFRVQKELDGIYKYISNDSLQNAEKIISAILSSSQRLAKSPETHPPDIYKLNNDGKFRAYELYHYRISYYVNEKEITIIRIRHTKMNPKEY